MERQNKVQYLQTWTVRHLERQSLQRSRQCYDIYNELLVTMQGQYDRKRKDLP